MLTPAAVFIASVSGVAASGVTAFCFVCGHTWSVRLVFQHQLEAFNVK